MKEIIFGLPVLSPATVANSDEHTARLAYASLYEHVRITQANMARGVLPPVEWQGFAALADATKGLFDAVENAAKRCSVNVYDEAREAALVLEEAADLITAADEARGRRNAAANAREFKGADSEFV